MSLGIKPRYHLTCPNWMNDPIPYYDAGVWHLFFQHNPFAPKWDTMHWGHATSTDLVNWTLQPIALSPTEPYELPGGIWTGCVIKHGPTYYAFYTAVDQYDPLRQTQCIATSSDLFSWTKHPGNPRIEGPPAGYGPCFRDPHVFFEDNRWKMIIGSQKEGIGGALLLYESDDLIEWELVGEALEGHSTETGFDFECPDLFPLGDQWVLITSRGSTHWQIGEWDGRTFTPHRHGTCDGPPFDGNSDTQATYYAAKTALSPDGRRILFGWITERVDNPRQNWNGAQALGRELFILPDGDLGMRPTRELNKLREAHLRSEPLLVPMNERRPMPGWSGIFSEFTFRADGVGAFDLHLRAAEKGDGTVVTFDPEERTLGGAYVGRGPVNVRAFVDGSIVSIFANDRACLTYRIAAPPDHDRTFIAAKGQPVTLDWLHSWCPRGTTGDAMRTEKPLDQ